MNLYDQSEKAKEDRLRAAGWFTVSLWGQPAWRSPDGKKSTLYTDTAIQWLEEQQSENASRETSVGDPGVAQRGGMRGQ